MVRSIIRNLFSRKLHNKLNFLRVSLSISHPGKI
jgi:hypothetical protein